MGRHDAVKQQLESRLRELRARVEEIQRDLASARHPDSEERATELENDEVLERLDERGSQEIRAIERALRRIEAGSYGVCAGCGEEISARRLAALPYTDVCLECAR
jgi:RNA polymerase-binding protein DksA